MEAREIVTEIVRRRAEGVAWDEIAILYRGNALSRLFEWLTTVALDAFASSGMQSLRERHAEQLENGTPVIEVVPKVPAVFPVATQLLSVTVSVVPLRNRAPPRSPELLPVKSQLLNVITATMPESGFSQAQDRMLGDFAESTT